MNEARETQEKPQRPMGVLSCLTTGTDVVARNPALIIIPVLLDIWLWLGPRLSLAPLLGGIQRELAAYATMDGLPDAAVENASFLIQSLKLLQERFNLFSLLQPAPLIGVPAIFTNSNVWSTQSPFGARLDIEVSNFFIMFAWQILLPLVGLVLSAVYLRSVGNRVIDETESPLPGPLSVWRIWLQLLLLGIGLLIGGLSLMVLVFTVAAIFGMVHALLAGMVLVVAGSMVLYIVSHLLFTIPGVVQLRRGLLRAIKESIMLTRADFFGVSLLISLLLIVTLGLNFVWTLPKPETWAMLVGILGHAFSSTAVITTLFVFYQDRLRFIRALQSMLSTQTQAAEASSSVSKLEDISSGNKTSSE